METENLKAQLIRAYNRGNNRWAFDGKSFNTSWETTRGEVTYHLGLTRTGDILDAMVSVHNVAGRYYPYAIVQQKKSLSGEDAFGDAFGWLAEAMVRISSELGEIAAELRNAEQIANSKINTRRDKLQAAEY